MKNITDITFASEAIPDPVEWVNQHHVLAGLLGTVTHIKQISTGVLEEDEHSDDFDQDWSLFRRTQDLIRGHYDSDNWQSLENYLLG